MTDCNKFPYGRFNNTSTNFKLFPPITQYTHKPVGNVYLQHWDPVSKTFYPFYPLSYRETTSNIKPGNIYSNSAKTLTKAEKFAYFIKFNIKR